MHKGEYLILFWRLKNGKLPDKNKTKDNKRFLKKDNNWKKLYLKKINLLLNQLGNKFSRNKKPENDFRYKKLI